MLEALLQSGFEALSLVPDSQALSRYRIYYEYLEEMNQVMNLTAISGEEDVARLHFLDCAALLGLADFAGKKVIDVGTGAGFPGLALKIACPAMELTLLDSLDKRINFLKNTCEKLGFDDVTCIHSRAEEIPAGFRQGFDFALSRAVARLNILLELTAPYVKVGGAVLAMKGTAAREELSECAGAMKKLGLKLEEVREFPIDGTSHAVIVLRKIAPTPKQYPRRYAKIKQSPL